MRVDGLAEPPGGPEREPEELELVGRCAGAVREQLEAFVPHVGIGFVGQQLDAVVERPDRAHQVMAQARAKQAGKVDGVHSALNGPEFNLAQGRGGIEP